MNKVNSKVKDWIGNFYNLSGHFIESVTFQMRVRLTVLKSSKFWVLFFLQLAQARAIVLYALGNGENPPQKNKTKKNELCSARVTTMSRTLVHSGTRSIYMGFIF